MSYPPPPPPEQPDEPGSGQPPPPPYGAAPPPPSYPPPPGYPYPAGAAGYAVPESNKKALWSMIAGILSLFCCGIVLGIVAIVLSQQAKNEIAASGGRQSGSGQAQAGLILGIIGIAVSVVLLAVVGVNGDLGS